MLKVGDKVPVFTLADQDDQPVHLDQYKGKWVVLYFYPKDNTSGCTTEACDFTAGLPDFTKLDAVVLGVSPDSTASHRKFRSGHDLKITLLSDPEHQVLEMFGAWQEKSMYGKKYMGVVRSTFIVDPKGNLAHAWPKVSVKGHVDEVRETLEGLKGR